MSLSPAEMSEEGQVILDYFNGQPLYAQALVTDAIVQKPNLFVTADFFDETIEEWLEQNHPDKLEEYRKEYM